MRSLVQPVVAAMLLAAVAPHFGRAAEFDDPEWPCIQGRVPELSVGQMWAGPPPAAGRATDPEVQALARRLAPRRVGVEDLANAADMALQEVRPQDRPEWLAELFTTILRGINAERAEIIAGIGRYATRQRAMADGVDTMQLELAALEQAPEADRNMDRIEELQDRVAWETRIYEDRAQSLTYVCETPVLLERRAFAIGRALAGLM